MSLADEIVKKGVIDQRLSGGPVATGSTLARVSKQAEPSDGGGFSLTGGLWTALKTIDKPRSAIVSTIKETGDLFQGEGFSFGDWSEQFGRNIGFNEVLDDMGVENVWARRIGGFVGDVALDPLTYLTGGINQGTRSITVADDAFRLASSIGDDALRGQLKTIGTQVVQRGPTSLTKTQVATYNAAKLADDAARKLGGEAVNTEFGALARKAATQGLSKAEVRQIQRAAPEALQMGARITVPGTGRVSRGVVRKTTGKELAAKSVQVLPQSAVQWTPRGLFQAARGGTKGIVGASQLRKLMGGDYTTFKEGLTSADPDRVATAWHALKGTEAGRNARQQFSNDAAKATLKVANNVPEKQHALIMPALLGDEAARAALDDEALTFVDEFAEEWRTAANKHAGNPELVRELETWSPHAFSEQAEELFGLLDDDAATRFVTRGIDPKNPQAKIAEGREFMGVKIVNQSADAQGRNVRQQAEDIFAAHLEDSGVAPIDSLFSDDFLTSAHSSMLYQAEQVGKERVYQELAKRGVAVEMGSNLADLQAKAAAKTERGHRILRGIKEQIARTKEQFITKAIQAPDAETARSAIIRAMDGDEAAAVRGALDEVNALTKANDATIGKATQVRRQLENLELEVSQLRREAATDISKAERYGARRAVLDTQIAQASKRLRELEAGLAETVNVPAIETEIAELGARVTAQQAKLEPLESLVNKAQIIQVREADFQALGYKNAKEAMGALQRGRAALEAADQYKAQLQRQLESVTPAGARTGLETTQWYRSQINQASDKLERRIAGKHQLIDMLDQQPEHIQLIAGASEPPKALANGRLGNRVGEEWGVGAASAMRGSDNLSSPTRFYGEVLTEGAPNPQSVIDKGTEAVRDAATGRIIPEHAQRYSILSDNPLTYAGGEPAMWMDGLEAMLRSGTKPTKNWGKEWGRVAAEVRAGKTLQDALQTAIPNRQPLDVVHDLVGGTVMDAAQKRSLAKAGRQLALRTGHDAITYLGDDGVWRAIPLDRNMVEGLTTEIPDDALRAINKLKQDQVDFLYEGEQIKSELAERLGYDLEALNDRIVDPTVLKKNRDELVARRDELADEFIRTGTRQSDEGSYIQRALDIDDAMAQVDDPAQLSVMALEREAAAANAKLEKLGKQAETMESFLARASKIDESQLKDVLNAGHRQVGANGDLQVPQYVADGLAGHAQIVNSPGAMLKSFDKVTRLWKAQAVASPGFHVRNALGGMINNYSAGVEIGRYRQFLDADKVYREAISNSQSVEQALQTVRDELGDLGDKYAQIRESGVLAGGQFDELAYISAGSVASANPFNEKFAAYRWGRKGGVKVEEYLRGALAMDTLYKGGTVDDAIGMVHKFHFDYEDLSSWERNVARRVIPFYTWSRKNLPLQLEMLVENPQTFMRYLAVQRNLEVGTEEESLMPSYFQRLNSIRLPFKPGGNQMYMTPQLPFSDLTGMTEWRTIASSANPLVRLPLELGAGQSFFTGAPFGERYDKMPVSWAPLAPALAPLGLVERDARGELQIKNSASHVVSGLSPLLGSLWRLDPSGPRPDDRIVTSAASWAFGLGTKVNTPYDQANEAYRRAKEYDGPIQRARELGLTSEQERLEQERFEWFEVASKLRDEAA